MKTAKFLIEQPRALVTCNREPAPVSSGIAQGAGYLAGKFGPQILSKFLPRNSNEFITMGDIGSALWSIPAVKVGGIRFISGTFGSIVNDF